MKKTYLRETVYNQLKEQIILGRLSPNDCLIENEVADKYQMSRTPVRDALVRLCGEGLITPLPKNGYIIRDLSRKDIYETFFLRILLEGEAAKLAAVEITAEKTAFLLSVMSKFSETDDVWSINNAFHQAVAQLSGNSRLEKQISQLLDESKRIILLDPIMRESNPTWDIDEHLLIAEAISEGKADDAKSLMEKHNRASQQRALRVL